MHNIVKHPKLPFIISAKNRALKFSSYYVAMFQKFYICCSILSRLAETKPNQSKFKLNYLKSLEGVLTMQSMTNTGPEAKERLILEGHTWHCKSYNFFCFEKAVLPLNLLNCNLCLLVLAILIHLNLFTNYFCVFSNTFFLDMLKG